MSNPIQSVHPRSRTRPQRGLTGGGASGLLTAPSDRRQDRDGIAVGDGRVERRQVAHVLVVHVDVNEAVQAAVAVDDPALEAWESMVEVLEEGPNGRAGTFDRGAAANLGAEDRG